MPLEETDSIDMILKPDEDGKVGLIITDAGITTDPEQRLELLMRKLHLYVGAIIEGALAEDCPGKEARDFFIQVVCATRPTPQMSEITQVGPRGDRVNVVPVSFAEFPEGAWGDDSDAETEEEGETLDISPEMEDAVELAFEAAGKWLETGQIPLFLLWYEGEKKSITPVQGCQSHDELIEKVRAWGRNASLDVSCCLLVSLAELETDGEEFSALVVHCSERGVPGFILGRRLEDDPATGKSMPTGEIFFHGEGENFLPAGEDDQPLP